MGYCRICYCPRINQPCRKIIDPVADRQAKFPVDQQPFPALVSRNNHNRIRSAAIERLYRVKLPVAADNLINFFPVVHRLVRDIIARDKFSLFPFLNALKFHWFHSFVSFTVIYNRYLILLYGRSFQFTRKFHPLTIITTYHFIIYYFLHIC